MSKASKIIKSRGSKAAISPELLAQAIALLTGDLTGDVATSVEATPEERTKSVPAKPEFKHYCVKLKTGMYLWGSTGKQAIWATDSKKQKIQIEEVFAKLGVDTPNAKW